MPLRFYIPPPTADNRTAYTVGDRLTLDAERSHYLCRVLRHRQDDMVECFDGAGQLMHCQVRQALPKASELSIEALSTHPSPPIQTHMHLALLKGAAMDRALAQCVEAGATAISLFAADRSNVSLDSKRLANKLSHWQKIIIGACEQCGQLYSPAFTYVDNLRALNIDASNVMALDMSGAPLSTAMATRRSVCVGPEGGWSADELRYFAEIRARITSIGPLTLRAESVPAAILTVLHHLDSTT